MMNLTARTPSFVSSSASSNPGRTSYGYQDPGISAPSDDRTGKPEKPSQSDFTQENYGRSLSSQEWKSEATALDRSVKPDKTSWRLVREVRPDHEEILLDGTAKSVRNGETLRDRSCRGQSRENLQSL